MTAIPLETPKLRNISNSEVQTYLQCQRKYYYSFVLKLQKKKQGRALNLGNAGHKILEYFYRDIVAKVPYETAKARALNDRFVELMNKEEVDLIEAMDLKKILTRYLMKAKEDTWTVLEVETKHEIDLTSEFRIVGRLDLIVEDDDELAIVDHKFIGKFYTEDFLAVNQQFPKYTGILRHNGYAIKKTIINMCKTKLNQSPMTDAQMFARLTYRPTDAQIKSALQDHIIVSRQIVEFQSLPPEQQFMATRNSSPMQCGYCPMLSLCKTDFQGGDTTLLMQLDYEKNTYDYNKPEGETENE